MDKITQAQSKTTQTDPLSKKQGVLKGQDGNREVKTESKPAGTLTFSKAPMQYLGLSISHLFSRIGDMFQSNENNTYRRAERTLSDPFASTEEKKAAAEKLISLDREKFAYAYRWNNEERHVRFERRYGEDPVLRMLAENPDLKETAAQYALKLYDAYLHVDITQKSYKVNESAIDKILESASEADKRPILQKRTVLSSLYRTRDWTNGFDQKSFLHESMTLADQQEALSTLFKRVSIKTERDYNSFKNAKGYQDVLQGMIEAVKTLPHEEAMEHAKTITASDSLNQSNLKAIFDIALSSESEAQRKESFEALLTLANTSPQSKIEAGFAAITSLNHSVLRDKEGLPTAECTALAESILKEYPLDAIGAFRLLETGALSKASALKLTQRLCASFRADDNSVKASSSDLGRLVDAYISLSPKLSNEERVDFLKTTLMPLLSHKSVILSQIPSSSLNTEAKATLAADLSKIAGTMSNAESPKLLKSIGLLMNAATHKGAERILSHEADFRCQHAIMTNGNLKDEVRKAGAKEAEHQLGQVHREATTNEFGKYNTDSAKKAKESAKIFVENGSYEKYDQEIVAFLKPPVKDRIKFESASFNLDLDETE